MRSKTRRYMATREPGYYPYYKLQWWNPIMLAWQDVQHRFSTATAALGGAEIPELGAGQAVRVREIQARGKLPVVVLEKPYGEQQAGQHSWTGNALDLHSPPEG